MSAIASIVIKDGQTTPVDHTFTPNATQRGNEPAVWYERVSGTPLGYNRITARVDVKNNGTSKVTLVIATPSLAVISAGCCVDENTPQVSYTEFANISFSIPSASTVATRKNILAFAKNILGLAVVSAMVVDLEPVY